MEDLVKTPERFALYACMMHMEIFAVRFYNAVIG